MENAFIIKGGKPLRGNITLSGAKNVALKVIIAALLFEQEIYLNNIPRISDVNELLHLIRSLGAKAEFIDKNSVRIDPRSLKLNKVDLFHASKIRVSYMLMVPLLYKFSECFVPNPGGCRIGARPIDRIVDGMKKLGVEIDYDSNTGYYQARLINKPTGSYHFPKETHTGTELLIMLSLFAKDKITLDNTAQEPEIDELIRFLNLSGAKIQKFGNKIIITPIVKLKLDSAFEIMTDRNEAVTFAVLAVATKGEVTISSLQPEFIQPFLNKMKSVGAGVNPLGKSLVNFYYRGSLKSSNIETSPHPGFMTDWQQPFVVLLTQVTGTSVIHETVYENRFGYTSTLCEMGADIESFNECLGGHVCRFAKRDFAHSIVVKGTTKLTGQNIVIPDLRAGFAYVMAALISEGESQIDNLQFLDRGYEELTEKLALLGANVERTQKKDLATAQVI